jgi:hypothetical protein
MIFSLSRLIHWVLEAARLDARGLPRQAEELRLTLLFVRVLRLWLHDASPDQQRSRDFLRRNLAWLDRLPRRARGGNGGAMAPGPRSDETSAASRAAELRESQVTEEHRRHRGVADPSTI